MYVCKLGEVVPKKASRGPQNFDKFPEKSPETPTTSTTSTT